MTSSQEYGSVWLIQMLSTGDLLGTRDRTRDITPEFGSRVPLTFPERRVARAAWQRYCVDQGYLVRGVTLPGKGVRYYPGEAYGLMPGVRFVRVLLVGEAFDIPTPEELHIDESA